MGAVRSPTTTIRVFAASPRDVAPEREILARVVNDLDEALQKWHVPLRLQLKNWERSVYPAPGPPQGVINKQIGTYDVFVGFMWRRLGTPAGEDGTGTEEEYRRAYRSWQDTGRPQHIMFYFSTALARPPRTVEEAQQQLDVVKFREEIEEQNLIAEYDGPADFDVKVRRHLYDVTATFLPEPPPKRQSKKKIDTIAREMQHAVRKKQLQRTRQERLINDAFRKVQANVRKRPARRQSNGKSSKAAPRHLKKDEVAMVVEVVTRMLNDARRR